MHKPVSAIAIAALTAAAAHAAPPHFEGFENPAYTTGGDNWNNNSGGTLQRVASGTNGITSATGTGHAIITDLAVGQDVFGNPSLGAGGPFTRFDGYSSDFDGGFTASLDVYLDTAWSEGQGFDYAVAANNNAGSHMRDFIWHVGVDNGQLLVSASNNTDFNINPGKLAGDNHTVTTTGWYTLEQVFYDNAGTLAVDFNLIDNANNTVFSTTINTTDDTANTGGNRYGWLTYNNIDGLAIDNTSLVPSPSTFAALSVAGLAAARRRRA